MCQSQWPIACWDCGFEYRRVHGCLSLVSFVCHQVEVCDGSTLRPEESYRLWCVVVCDLETSRIRRLWPALGCCTRGKKLTGMCKLALWKAEMKFPNG